MQRSVATAPGKAIIFGEHAVVYGTTAVAASLSELRISVDTRTEPGDTDLVVTFDDILREIDNKPSVATISLSTIKGLISHYEDPFVVVNPDEATKAALTPLFPDERSEVRNAMMSVVYIVGKVLSNLIYSDSMKAGLVMNVTSLGLPIGAGLGSSASFSVAVAASCLRLQALLFPQLNAKNTIIADGTVVAIEAVTPDAATLEVVNGWAFASEILLHGSPSGLDNTTSCYGGLVRFSRKDGEKFENITGVPALHILLVNTKVPRSTKALVAGVRVLHDAYTEAVTPMLDSMNHIALKFLSLIDEVKKDNTAAAGEARCDTEEKYRALVKQTGDLMTMNHHLLCAVGVGHPALRAVVEATAAASARYSAAAAAVQDVSEQQQQQQQQQLPGFSAKLTGAGGGGCAIILSPIPYVPRHSDSDAPASSPLEQNLHALVEDLRSLGCDVHHSTIAGKGVLWVV